jgi:uncharacterized protein YggE
MRYFSSFIKTILFVFACLFTLGTVNGQATEERFIEVTGESDMKVDANVINLSIELKEMKKDNKIVKIEDLENELQKALQASGVTADNIKALPVSPKMIEARKRNSELLITKRYTVKVADMEILNNLAASLADVNISSVNIADAGNSDIEKYRSEIRVKAINNAKDRASSLVNAAGGKLGKVLQIREIDYNEQYPNPGRQTMMRNAPNLPNTPNGPAIAAPEKQLNLSVEPIKLSYKVAVRFKIE